MTHPANSILEGQRIDHPGKPIEANEPVKEVNDASVEITEVAEVAANNSDITSTVYSSLQSAGNNEMEQREENQKVIEISQVEHKVQVHSGERQQQQQKQPQQEQEQQQQQQQESSPKFYQKGWH